MRSPLRTPFWQAAYRSLPENVRQRCLADIEQAERIGLAVDALFDGANKAKHALAGLFRTPAKPRSAH